MCKVEKYILTYEFETLFETYDKTDAENMQRSFNERLDDEKVVMEIHEVDSVTAVKDLLQLVQEKKVLIELQSQNFKKLKEQQDEKAESYNKTLFQKDEILKAQGKLLVELQKRLDETQKTLNLPQNRAQRDLLKEREKLRELERQLKGARA